MNTELEIDNAPEQQDTTDIGRLLKTKRLAMNLQERDLATELKISIEKVYSLENNEFERFRSATFARGYIKSYCRHVNMDYRPILKAFDVQQSDKESNIRPVDNVGSQSSAKDPIVYIVSGILIAIVVFVAFWWPTLSSDASDETPVASQSDSVAESAEEPIPEQDQSILDQPVNNEVLVASEAEEVLDQEEQSIPDNDGVVTGLSAETIALLEDAGVDPEAVVAATREPEATVETAAAPTQPAYSNDIEVQFSADCWTEVRDSTGTVLFSGVKSAGSTLELDGQAPYQVVLGYARGVKEFTYQGESFDFSSYVRKDLARFELN